jgi:hypothetical protein
MSQLSELDRIKILVQWLIGCGIAPNQESIGTLLGYKSKSSFSQIINGHVPLPKKFIESLYSLDERINRTWLLTGEGEMIVDKKGLQESLKVAEPEAQYGGSPKTLMESQAMLISIQEQLVRNNTKLVDTNNKLAEQVIELCSQQSSPGTKELIESIRKEVIESVKSELKNFHAREDAGCANVG